MDFCSLFSIFPELPGDRELKVAELILLCQQHYGGQVVDGWEGQQASCHSFRFVFVVADYRSRSDGGRETSLLLLYKEGQKPEFSIGRRFC